MLAKSSSTKNYLEVWCLYFVEYSSRKGPTGTAWAKYSRKPETEVVLAEGTRLDELQVAGGGDLSLQEIVIPIERYQGMTSHVFQWLEDAIQTCEKTADTVSDRVRCHYH